MASISLLTTPVPFPATGWWAAALAADGVILDGSAPFRKMADRNRYRIATAAGGQLLSIPVSGGRGQRTPMREVQIAGSDWQEQHWRTVFSAYGRAAYFEHYAPELEAIYRGSYAHLQDFSLRTLAWAMKALHTPSAHFSHEEKEAETTLDWRHSMPAAYHKTLLPEARHHQVFGNRHGFLGNMSILDLLMNEGPAAADWLRRNTAPEWFS